MHFFHGLLLAYPIVMCSSIFGIVDSYRTWDETPTAASFYRPAHTELTEFPRFYPEEKCRGESFQEQASDKFAPLSGAHENIEFTDTGVIPIDPLPLRTRGYVQDTGRQLLSFRPKRVRSLHYRDKPSTQFVPEDQMDASGLAGGKASGGPKGAAKAKGAANMMFNMRMFG